MNPEITSSKLLRFQFGNAKLSKLVAHISLPAGFTCPGAKECLTYANRKTRKLKDGPDTEFRCYAAGMEARYPAYHDIVWHNFDLINQIRDDEDADVEYGTVLEFEVDELVVCSSMELDDGKIREDVV